MPVTFFRNFGVQGTRFWFQPVGSSTPAAQDRGESWANAANGLQHKALSCRVESCSTARTMAARLQEGKGFGPWPPWMLTRDFQQLPGHTTTLPLTDRRMLDQTAGAEIIEGSSPMA